jgi:hypothetical protein
MFRCHMKNCYLALLQEFASWDTGLQAIRRKRCFIVLAQTQRTHVQRLRPKNKGVSPYVPLQEGYRSRKQGLIHICLYLIFIGYFTLMLHGFPLPGTMWPSSCSDFSGFISLVCHPYLPATFSGLRPRLFSSDPPPCNSLILGSHLGRIVAHR